jgi:hypothetical protein
MILILGLNPNRCAISAHRPGNTGSLTISCFMIYPYSNSIYSFYPLSVAHVRELWLEQVHFETIDDGVTDEYLQSIFFSLPALDTLVLINCELGAIFQMLQPRGGHIPCPSLTSLTIYVTSGIDYLCVSGLAAMRELRGAPFKNISLLCDMKGTLRLEGVECLPKCVDIVEDCHHPPKFSFWSDIPTHWMSVWVD